MEERVIFDEIKRTKDLFGCGCRKLSGALTVEVLKSHLEKYGFAVSNRDVFIRGIGSELDLLIVRKGANPEYGVIYEPDDVLAVFEIKNYGTIFSPKEIAKRKKDAISQIRDTFTKIESVFKEKGQKVFCCYLTLLERKSYKRKVTSEILKYPAFTMSFHKGEGKKMELINTGEWDKFLEKLRTVSLI